VFRTAILQTTVPDHLQGRLGGVFTAVVTGGPRLGDAEAGAVAAIGGVQTSVVSGGVACVAGVALILWRVPELWSYEVTTRARVVTSTTEALRDAVVELTESDPG
jgi:hypothetical protein